MPIYISGCILDRPPRDVGSGGSVAGGFIHCLPSFSVFASRSWFAFFLHNLSLSRPPIRPPPHRESTYWLPASLWRSGFARMAVMANVPANHPRFTALSLTVRSFFLANCSGRNRVSPGPPARSRRAAFPHRAPIEGQTCIGGFGRRRSAGSPLLGITPVPVLSPGLVSQLTFPSTGCSLPPPSPPLALTSFVRGIAGSMLSMSTLFDEVASAVFGWASRFGFPCGLGGEVGSGTGKLRPGRPSRVA